MYLATSKIYGHDELHIPKEIKKTYTHTPLQKGTIIDWEIRDNEIILRPRKKVTVEDIIGIVK